MEKKTWIQTLLFLTIPRQPLKFWNFKQRCHRNWSLTILYSHHKILTLCIYNNIFLWHTTLEDFWWREVYYKINYKYKLLLNVTWERNWHSNRFPWNHLLILIFKQVTWTKLPTRSFDFYRRHRCSAHPSSVPTAPGPKIIQTHLCERGRAAQSWWELYSAKRRHICSPWLTWCGVQWREQCENQAVAVTQCPGAEPKWELGKLGEDGRSWEEGEEDENDNKRIKAAEESERQSLRD